MGSSVLTTVPVLPDEATQVLLYQLCSSSAYWLLSFCLSQGLVCWTGYLCWVSYQSCLAKRKEWILSGWLEMGCWMTEADAFYESQLFHWWCIRLVGEVSSGTVILHKEFGYWETKHSFKRLAGREHRQSVPPCSSFPDQRKAIHHWPELSHNKPAQGSPSVPAVSSHHRQTDSWNSAWFLFSVLLTAPSDADHRASISSCTGASSAKRAWLCSPWQLKALGGTSSLHQQAERSLALQKRPMPSEVCSVRGHLSSLFVSIYCSLLKLAH